MDIYSQGTRDEWLEFFGVSSAVTTFCDDQFFIDNEVKLAFFVLDPNHTGTRFIATDSFMWIPTQKYLTTSSCYQQFEEFLVAKPSHIMVRLPDETFYTYVGQGGSYSQRFENIHLPGKYLIYAIFTLQKEQWLPRNLWVKWGGYIAWQLIFDGEVQHLSQWAEIEPYALRLFNEEDQFHHFVLERYQGDALHASTTDERVNLMYVKELYDSGILSRDAASDCTDKELIDFYVYDGHHTQMLACNFIPKTHLIAVLRQYVETGTLSHLIQWTDVS